MTHTTVNKTENASQPNTNPVFIPTNTSASTKNRTKYNNSKLKKVSQGKLINHTTYSTYDESINSIMLRPISTILNPDRFLLLDSGATIILFKHKEMLHNIHDSHSDSIQITSCSNINILFNREDDLGIQTLNGKHVTFHVFLYPNYRLHNNFN